ncbi:MAG: zinc ABC transporter substrate-binding protein [Candidatus Marinimicrobia bacterium]|nr:zinc ABC transporter substrate-binding protein [Candidatus Neomarinimicrobiota bacterium]MBL7010877.1 zinc ABC transporter substrate-binding protein [Candidatus Neomarinimicrobiota bacterium]MBL7030251.1 zinc ABC transporter substrate-binding protein [Candidatus Neomarinimicrobiota bacterium]
MKKHIILLTFLSFCFGKVRVVTSTTDLADIVKTIGGDQVTVTSIARGNQDPHYVEVLPSYMFKVRKADLYFMVGMELDLWAQQIIDGSRNRKIKVIDCSVDINKMEVPTGQVDASMGDIHKFGNPHYWLDPENGKLIAQLIADKLANAAPKSSDLFQQNLDAFNMQIDRAILDWDKRFRKLQGKKLIYYHNSWPYFSDRFGLVAVEFLEPKPGITPSPSKLNQIIQLIETDTIQVVASESYFSERAPKFIASKTGVKTIKLAQSVGALNGADSYINLFETNLKILSEAFGIEYD